MPIGDALKFIEKLKNSTEFRNEINSFNSTQETYDHILKLGYNFTLDEFDDAMRSQLLKCQYQEQAEELKEIQLWINFLLR